MWDDILIPRFRDAFALNYFQAMLVQLAFFGAYATGGLVYTDRLTPPPKSVTKPPEAKLWNPLEPGAVFAANP